MAGPGGTAMGLGNLSRRYDLALGLARLDRLLAYEPAELVGSSIVGIVHPDDLPKMAEASQAAGAGRHVSYRARFREKGGGWRWLWVVAAMIAGAWEAAGKPPVPVEPVALALPNGAPHSTRLSPGFNERRISWKSSSGPAPSRSAPNSIQFGGPSLTITAPSPPVATNRKSPVSGVRRTWIKEPVGSPGDDRHATSFTRCSN